MPGSMAPVALLTLPPGMGTPLAGVGRDVETMLHQAAAIPGQLLGQTGARTPLSKSILIGSFPHPLDFGNKCRCHP